MAATTTMFVYVVQGRTGEWECRKDWLVRAFLRRKSADEFCTRLNAWCKEHSVYMDPDVAEQPFIDVADRMAGPPDDPQCYIDYTGVQYTVLKVPIDSYVTVV